MQPLELGRAVVVPLPSRDQLPPVPGGSPPGRPALLLIPLRPRTCAAVARRHWAASSPRSSESTLAQASGGRCDRAGLRCPCGRYDHRAQDRSGEPGKLARPPGHLRQAWRSVEMLVPEVQDGARRVVGQCRRSATRLPAATQTRCGHPESETTSGLVAYLDGEPVGWCAVEPRTAYPRMLRNNRVPWEEGARTRPTAACGP
jgi:hypothetical protein